MVNKLIRKIRSKFFNNPFGTQNNNNRNKWLEEKLTEIPSGLTILDAGAGNTNKKKYCSHLNYISQDIAEYEGTGNENGLHTGEVDYSNLDIISDITDIPISNNSVDAVMCTEVLEHIDNPLLAFKEFSRILKNGGKLIITAPFNSLTHYAPYHYSTGFSRYYYEKHLPNYGFKITEIKENGSYFEYMAQEIRRIEEVSKKYSNLKFSSPLFIIARSYIIKYLKKQNFIDKNSYELLCFGYFVIAEKV